MTELRDPGRRPGRWWRMSLDLLLTITPVVTYAVLITITLILPVERQAPACQDPDAGCMRTAWDATYWVIVTASTTGYGDISPQTAIGQAWALSLMASGLALSGLVLSALVAHAQR